jgi:hypothetical protein
VLKYDATVLQKMNIIKAPTSRASSTTASSSRPTASSAATTLETSALMVAGTSPLDGKDVTGAPIKDPRAAAELWLKGETIRSLRVPGRG